MRCISIPSQTKFERIRWLILADVDLKLKSYLHEMISTPTFSLAFLCRCWTNGTAFGRIRRTTLKGWRRLKWLWPVWRNAPPSSQTSRWSWPPTTPSRVTWTTSGRLTTTSWPWKPRSKKNRSVNSILLNQQINQIYKRFGHKKFIYCTQVCVGSIKL